MSDRFEMAKAAAEELRDAVNEVFSLQRALKSTIERGNLALAKLEAFIAIEGEVKK